MILLLVKYVYLAILQLTARLLSELSQPFPDVIMIMYVKLSSQGTLILFYGQLRDQSCVSIFVHVFVSILVGFF